MEQQFKGGAFESPKDKRTLKADTLVLTASPRYKGGYDYLPQDLDDQHAEGICTGISTTQNMGKANGNKYSADFQYLLQKKFYDKNWIEGSSALSALKVAKKYGFLPASEWKHTTEADRFLPYSQYIAKLQAVPDSEIDRLIKLCIDPIEGYAQVNFTNPQEIAKYVDESPAGLICRFEVGEEWWKAEDGRYSKKESDISPLRPPKKIISGHLITMSGYDLNLVNLFTVVNTWGRDWCREGSADFILDRYKPTEVWLITRKSPIMKFNEDLYFGLSGYKVANLQNALKIKGFFNYKSTGYFGPITYMAVKAFQKANGISSIGRCGPQTRAELNRQFNLR